MGTRSGDLRPALRTGSPRRRRGNPLRPSHGLRVPQLGSRPPGNANSQISGGNDCQGPLVNQHGGRPERPRVSDSRRPPMDRRGRLQAYSSPDRSRPAPPLWRRVGVPQKAIVARHLELLRDQNTPHVLRGEAVPEFGGLMMFPAMLLGPTVVGIVLTGVVDGTSGLRDIFSRICRVRVTAAQESLWYAV